MEKSYKILAAERWLYKKFENSIRYDCSSCGLSTRISSRTTVLQLLKSRTHATVSDRWYYASTLMKSIFKLFYINSWSNTGGTYIRRNAKISILIFGKFNIKLYQCTISELILANVLIYSVNLTFFSDMFQPYYQPLLF